MKINNTVSFGQTFLQDSLKNMSPQNRDKLYYSYGLGELYPVDIYLGATKQGDLTVGIRQANLWDYLTINNEIPMTTENVLAYTFIKRAQMTHDDMYGPNVPYEISVVKNIDYMEQEEIGYEIRDKIADYYKKYAHKFYN
jgi:hypothetical protein